MLYCCYCGSQKGYRMECCGEADFVPLRDLPKDMLDPDELISDEYLEGEE